MEIMSTTDLSDFLRTPESTIRYWRSKGEGPPAVKVGRRYLYSKSDVEAWLVRLAGKAKVA